MSHYRKAVGKMGEDRALAFLSGKGYIRLGKNYSNRWGEIDLIMEKGETIVFVEVKHRTEQAYGAPEEAVTRHKQTRMTRVAVAYIQENGLWERNFRFDVVSISGPEIRHIENAFLVSGNIYY